MLTLLRAGLHRGTANGTCEGGPLCSADTVREVQRGSAHLHSFVIPEETKCSESKVTAESPTERHFLHIECEKKRKRGGDDR